VAVGPCGVLVPGSWIAHDVRPRYLLR
jgi:hypothetical protein